MSPPLTTDLLGADGAERLPLADADILLWRRIELGQPAQNLMTQLIDKCDWRQEQITVYGKSYLQPRLSAWYGDRRYRYSGITLEPLPWTDILLQLRNLVQSITQNEFNSVLLNYYRDQNDAMGLHSDDERELGAHPAIASLSLGEERRFILKHKTRKTRVKLPLTSGSLLLMQGQTQRYWRHGIARQRRGCGPRLNLTFRHILAAAKIGG